MNDVKQIVRCSFCGKSSRSVKKMIAGPDGVNICDECVRLCRDIVREAPVADTDTVTFADMRPHAISAFLDEHIVGQKRAKVALSVAVYNHYKRIRETEQQRDARSSNVRATDARKLTTASEAPAEVELSKGNILMIGPTGTGKTLIARTLARKLGVPFTIADATTLTEAGYVGEDVESIVKNLWLAANRDPLLAGQGIVCIDEVDKISRSGSSPSSVRDVGGEGVQQALLKVLESQKVSIPPEGARNRPQQEYIEIDTTNILFVCCGAFEGLEELVQRRLSRSSIGFGAPVHKTRAHRSEVMKQIRAEDLVKFGLIPEFVGRLPVIVTLDDLEHADLLEILWRPRNALVKQYQRLFALEGVKLTFEREALVAIVDQAIDRRTGARGLRSIIEHVMLDIMYELPSMTGVEECVITEDVVRNGAAPVLRPGETAA